MSISSGDTAYSVGTTYSEPDETDMPWASGLEPDVLSDTGHSAGSGSTADQQTQLGDPEPDGAELDRAELRERQGGPTRRPVTGPQRVAGILITVVCVASALWYVPRILTADGHSFTGTVNSTGVTDLNFASSGRMGQVQIHLGQIVKAGQVLATETAPETIAAVSADKAAIAADMASLAEFRANPPLPEGTVSVAAATAQQAKDIAAAQAQQAKDEAQLAADQVKLVETTIVAPSAGTVVAINGQVGETVTSAGIRNYSSQSQNSSAQEPAFSLLPEGPTATVKGGAAGSALPVIALRTSSNWQVVMLVPEGSTSAVRNGQDVTVSVPAVGLRGLRGYVQQMSPTPVTTSAGVAYQALVNIRGHQRVTPLGGMTADIQLGS